ncbi:MAG: hypothetical protein MMC23_004350 [Stictis urceolatum]|nr:hypothetical protein [Stictis urceolata]
MRFGRKIDLAQEPTAGDIHAQQGRRPSAVEAVAHKHDKKVSNRQLTGASQITLKQSIIPVSLVTILFFLWGFAYGLLDVLNKHFQETLGVTRGEGGGLAAAYFGAYFLAPLTYSGYVCRRFGYRWTFIMGLCIYGVGALMFWPSAIKRSFGGFCGSMFIVGSGLATLETAANPYISVCGPPRYSEIRLNLSQSFQAIGTVVAPLLAAKVIFKDVDAPGGKSLDSVQWVYLGIACFVFLLAVVFFFAPIPEISDADMMDQAEQSTEFDTMYEDKPMRKQYTLFFGVMAQFMYVGPQVAIAGYFINYVTEVRPGTSSSRASDQLAIAQSLFAIGRFTASFSMKWVKPRYVYMLFSTMIILWICVAIGVEGDGGIAALSLVLFFESCIFPTIFTLSLRGLGRHTKRGASFIVSSVVGGAVFPPVLGAVADIQGTRIAMVIPLVGFVLSWMFPIYLNLYKGEVLDAYRTTTTGLKDSEVRKMHSNVESDADQTELEKEKPEAKELEVA